MKSGKLVVLLAVLLLVFTFTACEEEIEASCFEAGKIEHTIENGQATISVDPDSGVRILRYHVPGTIDAFYTGVICNEVFPDFQITEDFNLVTFSGNFLDDGGRIQFTTAIGGEEYFYLDLTYIEQN